MPSISESLNSQSQLADTLAAGVNTLSQYQVIQFTQYSQTVLPADGYIFYVNTGTTQAVQGSLHYATNQNQNEDETIDVNRVVFTALSKIDLFNEAAPTDLFIGTFEGLQFAFSARGSFYQQANLYHYVGNAVYPALSSQLIDSEADLPTEPIVSNSLPIWLAQNSFAPVYPSFLVPANVVPPYITAHVESSMTEAPTFPTEIWPGTAVPNSGASPLYDLSSRQLAKDKVRLTLYGFNNQTAQQFYMSLIDYSMNTDDFGFANTPVPRDEKRTQVEMAVIAMKKTLDIEAWYYQGTADAIARRLILSAAITITTS